jgi:hypothetical protein
MSNTRIWDQVEKTDPKYTKGFSRGGGFRGTATNATYLAKRATEVFGPCGTGWGLDIVNEEILAGAPLAFSDAGLPTVHEKIHKVLVELWYKQGDQVGKVTQYGQTTFVGKNKNGYFTDEEAPKKSLTDAMSKCLSLLGFAADIHLGLYDDNKYVADLTQEFDQKREQAQREAAPKVSEKEAQELADLIAETDTDLKKFLKFFKVGGLAEFTQEDYERAKRMLTKKKQDAAQ